MSKRAIVLWTIFTMSTVEGALACTETVTSDVTLSGTVGCSQVLQSGSLTLTGQIDNSSADYAIRTLTSATSSGIYIAEGASVLTTGANYTGYWAVQGGIAVGDGVNSYSLGRVENAGILLKANATGEMLFRVFDNATLGEFFNAESGRIEDVGGGKYVFWVEGTVGSVENHGLIKSTGPAFYIAPGGRVDSFLNGTTGIVRTTTDWFTAIDLFQGSVGTFINNGLIDSASEYAVYLENTPVDRFINRGEVRALSGQGDAMLYSGTDTLGQLDNFQGLRGSGGTKLTYGGALPDNYKVIIDGDRYGQLSIINDGWASETTLSFGISDLSGQITSQVYASVLSGLASSRIETLSGSFEYTTGRSADWELRETGPGTGEWDLFFLSLPVYGIDATLTRAQVVALAKATQDALEKRILILRSALDEDCAQFGQTGQCVKGQVNLGSSGAQYNLAASFRITGKLRAGLLAENGSAASGSETTVAENGTRLGLFVGYGEAGGAGLAAHLSAAQEESRFRSTRRKTPGTELGSGSTTVSTHGIRAEVGYGYRLDRTIITPFTAISSVQAVRSAYEETDDGSLEFPLRYSTYKSSSTLGTIGVKLRKELSERSSLRGQVSLDRTLTERSDPFSFTGAIVGLGGPINVRRSDSASRWNAAFFLEQLISKGTVAELGVVANRQVGRTQGTFYASLTVSF